MIAAGKGIKRKGEHQFVVDGEQSNLGATGMDVEVLRAFTMAAKRSKKGVPIKLGARKGTATDQARHLHEQLELFFRDHNDGSDVFKPM